MKPFIARVKILCLGIASAFILACGPAPSTGSIGGVELYGKWTWVASSFVVLNNTAGTSCPVPTVIAASVTDTVNILTYESNDDALISGFLGLSTNQLSGTLGAGTGGSLAELPFQGSYPQANGTWTADSGSVLSVEDTSMMGDESWTWVATTGGTSCSGHAQITVTRR